MELDKAPLIIKISLCCFVLGPTIMVLSVILGYFFQ